MRGDPACARHSSLRRADSPPARSCTSADSSNSPPAKARRSRRLSPTFLNALVGKGVHVTTVNDYLAQRDAEWIGPVYQKLGLTVGCLQQKMDDADRTAAYRRDVTYGTASEFGFDFLRDRLKVRGGQAATAPFWAPWMPGADAAKMDPRVQRALHYAIVDEADSIFIDEAKTPLIIANPTRPAEPEEQVVYLWADQRRPDHEARRALHFMNLKKDKIELTDAGRHLVRYSNPPTGKHAKAMDKLLEPSSGRCTPTTASAATSTTWSTRRRRSSSSTKAPAGRCPTATGATGCTRRSRPRRACRSTWPVEHAAQITFQNFYRLYKKLAGMTGTLLAELLGAAEGLPPLDDAGCRRTGRASAMSCPTRSSRPRTRSSTRSWRRPSEMLTAGRPVLIGTRTVEKSKKLSAKLHRGRHRRTRCSTPSRTRARPRSWLQAGQPGTVTVATNMAGRGTDIKLGPGVAEAGGLHVIGTERHEAERIDRQLIGRAGRQGDPGTAEFFLSLEDQLLEGLGTQARHELAALGRKAGGNRNWNAYAPLFRIAQRRIEKRHYKQRLDLMNYDKQRQEMLKDIGADPYVD